MHSETLRTSLLVAGVAVAGFLVYTQGAIFDSWITYMTGLAAAVPAMIKLLATIRSGERGCGALIRKPVALFIAQRFDRIKAGGFDGRVHAEEEADGHGDADGEHHGPERNG